MLSNRDSQIREGYSKFLTIMVMVGILYLVVCFFGDYVNSGNSNNDDYDLVEVEVPFEKRANGTRVGVYDVNTNFNSGDGLFFYTSHSKVEVYDGEKRVYIFDFPKKKLFGRSPGSKYHTVYFTPDTKEVKIVITPAFDIVADKPIVFFRGDVSSIAKTIVKSALPEVIASVCILAVGIVMIGCWAYVNSKHKVRKTLYHLGIFSITMGLWSLNETEAIKVLNSNYAFSYNLAYICLLVMGLPYLIFTKEYLDAKDDKLFRRIILADVIFDAVIVLLHVLGLRDFRENIYLIHGALGLLLFIAAFTVFNKIITRTIGPRVWIAGVCTFLVGLAFIGDAVGYYGNRVDADMIGRYAFLVLITILGLEQAAYSASQLSKDKVSQDLEEFALTDTMTGLYNRNAFNQVLSGMKDPLGTMYVICDLNNLKACNDTYGHQAGDEYITTAAEIVYENFSAYGRCYRIGGDEMAIIVKAGTSIPIDRIMSNIRSACEKINASGTREYIVEIAVGYACFDHQWDKEFADTMQRADERMYNNKRALKEARANKK